jgi:hypothetical protein
LQISMQSAMALGPGLSLRIGATVGVVVVFILIQFVGAGKCWPYLCFFLFPCASFFCSDSKQIIKKNCGLSPRLSYTDRATAACRRS